MNTFIMSLPSTSQINIDASVKSRHMSEGASCLTETKEIYGEKMNRLLVIFKCLWGKYGVEKNLKE